MKIRRVLTLMYALSLDASVQDVFFLCLETLDLIKIQYDLGLSSHVNIFNTHLY